MNPQDNHTTRAGIKPADIFFILFRRKWLILTFVALGIIGSALFYFLMPPSYTSQARLFIRYVLEKSAPTEGQESQIRRPDANGNNIINSEVQIISSFDLALQVVDVVKPSKILPSVPGQTPSRHEAAKVVSKGLRVEAPMRSDVVQLSFSHADPSVVQPVLAQLITSYLKKHDEIHRASGVFDEMLTQQTDTVRLQLVQTEEDLRKLRQKAGLNAVEETKQAFTEEISRLRQEIHNGEAELSERRAMLLATPTATKKPGALTNTLKASTAPREKTNEYRAVLAKLESLRRREQELLRQFTVENFLVKTMQEQIADAEKTQADLEKKYPELLVSTPSPQSQPATSTGFPIAPALDPAVENARIVSLEARLKTLKEQLANVTAEMSMITDVEPEIARLERKRDVEEAQYRHFQTSLQQARFDESLGAGRLSNIGVAQSPSPPFKESRKTLKVVGMIMAGCIALGLALAFLWEMYLNPSVKTLDELERRFDGSVFLSIPELGGGNLKGSKLAGLIGDGDPKSTSSAATGAGVVTWTPSNPLQVYYEGLRDRLMTWFEIKNLTRKPKLVAVTSCNHGAGVSTVAAGLASTLSETGDGRVLLVDMNVGEGAAHAFYKGKPGLGIDGALESEKRDEAQVQENLFVVAEGASNRDKLPSILPRRFMNLVPKLKASDFDYIIFDMPPVSPITVTPRLSAYMDVVLLVVEAEKTSKGSLAQATNLLAQSKANVAAVMNKSRKCLPDFLTQGAPLC